MKTLERADDVTPNQLAVSLAVHQSSISSLLRRLEQGGHIVRVRASDDRRSVQVQLTPKGRALVQRAPEPAQGRLLHGLKGMPRARLRALRHSIEALVTAMEASDLEARFFFSDD